ncbi:tyrosine-type recombinase/integrase [Erwinia sp. S38]|nr:tyrosine-type recombinase/integrase [Erwinia sp. S38]
MTKHIQNQSFFLSSTADDAMRTTLEEFVEDKDAFSPNTWRQLLSVMRICYRWAEEHGRTFFPISPADLRDYLSWLQSRGRSSSTIASHAALIAMLHRNAGLVSPGTSPLVFRTLKKINRSAVVSGERTGQAVPFRLSDLSRLDARWAGSDRLQQVRDLAFLHLAYNTLLRVSELSRLRVGDISRTEDGRIILDVAWTKTIVQTGGLIKALSSHSSQRLTEWLMISGLAAEPDAYLFCPVHRSNSARINNARPLTLPALENIFLQAWREVGPATPAKKNKGRYQGWSGHSARVGAAQDMARQGYSVPQIMQEGTWKKPETLMRYIRNVDAHNGAMVDFMENGFN